MIDNHWNQLTEHLFSEFLKGEAFDTASESIFQLARSAFIKGYELGVMNEKAESSRMNSARSKTRR